MRKSILFSIPLSFALITAVESKATWETVQEASQFVDLSLQADRAGHKTVNEYVRNLQQRIDQLSKQAALPTTTTATTPTGDITAAIREIDSITATLTGTRKDSNTFQEAQANLSEALARKFGFTRKSMPLQDVFQEVLRQVDSMQSQKPEKADERAIQLLDSMSAQLVLGEEPGARGRSKSVESRDIAGAKKQFTSILARATGQNESASLEEVLQGVSPRKGASTATTAFDQELKSLAPYIHGDPMAGADVPLGQVASTVLERLYTVLDQATFQTEGVTHQRSILSKALHHDQKTHNVLESIMFVLSQAKKGETLVLGSSGVKIHSSVKPSTLVQVDPTMSTVDQVSALLSGQDFLKAAQAKSVDTATVVRFLQDKTQALHDAFADFALKPTAGVSVAFTHPTQGSNSIEELTSRLGALPSTAQLIKQ